MLNKIPHYSKTQIYRAPIYHKPWLTTANFFPQIELNMYIVNKQNPNLPQTLIYLRCFLFFQNLR